MACLPSWTRAMAKRKHRIKARHRTTPSPQPTVRTRSEPTTEIASKSPAGEPKAQSSSLAANVQRFIPALLIAAAVAAYHNSFTGPFIFDDYNSITNNPYIRKLWPLTHALSWPKRSTVAGRPVVGLSLAVNYALGGFGVRGYHVFNLALHILAGLVLFGVVRRTLENLPLREGYPRRAPWLAMAVALLWMLHPLNTESVTYVIQRTEVLFGLFLLLTLYCVIRGASSSHPGRWYTASVAACALGMGSKETMVTAPLIVLLYDRCFLSRAFQEAFRRRASLYAGLASTWLLLATLVATGPHYESAGFSFQSLTPWGYARTQFGVIVHYLRLAFWPHPLVLDYYDWPVANTVSAIVPQAVAVLTLLGATLWALRDQPRLGFLGAWFFIILGPTSSVLPLVGEVAAERRMYVPLVAVVTLIVIGGDAGLRYLLRPSKSGETLRWYLEAGVVVAAAATLGSVTLSRNKDYRSVLSVWSDAVAKRPNNARGHNMLAWELYRLGRLQEARFHYSESARIRPNFPEVRNNLGAVLLQQGQLDEAIASLSEAIRLDPNYAKAHRLLAVALDRKGRSREAIEHYSEALRLVPGDADLYSNLAWALHREGRLEDAVAQYSKSLRFRPNHAWTHYNLGVALVRLGRIEEAARHFESAVQLEPDHPQARRALADLRGGVTRPDSATR